MKPCLKESMPLKSEEDVLSIDKSFVEMGRGRLELCCSCDVVWLSLIAMEAVEGVAVLRRPRCHCGDGQCECHH